RNHLRVQVACYEAERFAGCSPITFCRVFMTERDKLLKRAANFGLGTLRRDSLEQALRKTESHSGMQRGQSCCAHRAFVLEKLSLGRAGLTKCFRKVMA